MHTRHTSYTVLLKCITDFLLTSRLYCRFWNRTKSAAQRFYTGRGLYRRSGISPSPEEFSLLLALIIEYAIHLCKYFLLFFTPYITAFYTLYASANAAQTAQKPNITAYTSGSTGRIRICIIASKWIPLISLGIPAYLIKELPVLDIVRLHIDRLSCMVLGKHIIAKIGIGYCA